VVYNKQRDYKNEQAKERDNFTIEHNGCSIEFYGVSHIPQTWLAQGEKLMAAISNADTVIIESNPSTVSEGEGRKLAHQVATTVVKENPSMAKILGSPEALENFIAQDFFSDKNVFFKFFRPAARIASAGEKQVLSADPEYGQTLTATMLEAMLDIGATIGDQLDTARIFAQAAAVGVGGGTAMRSVMQSKFDAAKAPTKEQKETIGRRGFLKGMAAMFGASMINHSLDIPKIKGGLGEEKDGVIPADARLYNTLDYRNLVVAKGLDTYIKQNPGKKILVLYGMAHVRGIENYLKNPTLTSIKDAVYGPFAQGRTPHMNEYKMNENGDWSEKTLFDIA
jgi:hypothetical protein